MKSLKFKTVNKKKLFAIIAIVALLVFVIIYAGIKTSFFIRLSNQIEYWRTGQVQTNEGYYEGDLDFGVFEGKGTFTYNTKKTLTGKWSDNLMQGDGIAGYPNVGKYDGNFKNSKRFGTGTFTWNNGDKYIGEWSDDKINGIGELTWATGDKYSGSFKNNAIDGQGTLAYVNGDNYNGLYSCGLRNGEGTYQWHNGDYYEGEWKDDAITGYGKVIFQNNDELDGEFDNGKLVSGHYKTKTKKAKYDITIEDSTVTNVVIKYSNKVKYDGEYSNNKFNGQGTITYKNGDEYKGEFKNGLKSGTGEYTWKNGAKYTGDWSKDKMNGSGTYYYKKSEKGLELVGTFKNNKPNGKCKYYTDDYTWYETTWKNGKCIKLTE